MSQLRSIPDWTRVVDRFGGSRATAYRMLQAWRDANGIPPAPRGMKLSKAKRSVGYRRAEQEPQTCGRCVHFGQPVSLAWNHCLLHDFPVRRTDVCSNFKARNES
jgi:hypothetical protein